MTETLDPAYPRPPAEIDAWLRAGGAGAPFDRLIETSISWIYLLRDRALKLKKPVDLGFLDFSSVGKREDAVERELRFNRVTAPDIYRAARPIGRNAGGQLCFDPVSIEDWALEMRRFDEAGVLINRLDSIDGEFAERLGRGVARFHAAAEPARLPGAGAEGLSYVRDSNARLLRGETAELGVAEVETLLTATAAAFEAASPLLDARAALGFVRCCHGDLHLGNILVEDDRPVLFDCIEFNQRLREIDVLYDVAFLLMDLAFRGATPAANRVLNGWLDEMSRTSTMGLYEGLAALPLFQSIRATVRTHVNALECRSQPEKAAVARRYMAASLAHLASNPPVLVAVGGLSGSGKTTLARALAPRLGAAPGAVVLRSDEIRKRLWGRAPTDRLPPEAYAPGESARVYDHAMDSAEACLRAGRTVILDAVFLRESERRRASDLARMLGVPFRGVWLQGDPDVLRRRIDARTGDASDADERVLGLQLDANPGEIAWLRWPAETASERVGELQARLEAPKSGA